MNDTVITTPAALHTLCTQLQDAPWIALDTEFIRERTYYAKLCLIQVATPDLIACVDPLALDNLDPLLDLIYRPDILKVLHSARQDIEVLYDLRKTPPAPIFDTQIAAAYLGFDDQIGYAPLVDSITGVKLDKAHTRTDWSARPLQPEQIHYAEDDVRYLRDIYLHLRQRLSETGREDWVVQDFAQLSDPALYRNEPAQAWRRVKNGHQLPPASQGLLQKLAAWRETTAQTKDLPRSWVLRDATLFDIARRTPRDREQLALMRDMDEHGIRKWADAVLEIVATGPDQPATPLWPQPTPLTPEQTRLLKQMAATLDAVAKENHISAAVLATRRDIQRLLLGETDLPLLRGWRLELVGRRLRDMTGGTPHTGG